MDILTLLRAQTSDLHKELDALVEKEPIVASSGYNRFLLMHAKVLPGAERWLSAQSDDSLPPNFSERLRSAALFDDLAALQLSPSNEIDMSFLNDKPSVIGMTYVLEGSRLGGAYLSAQLEKSGAEFPTYFLRHGQGRSFWKSYVEWLRNLECDEDDMHRAAQSAKDLFQAYMSAVKD